MQTIQHSSQRSSAVSPMYQKSVRAVLTPYVLCCAAVPFPPKPQHNTANHHPTTQPHHAHRARMCTLTSTSCMTTCRQAGATGGRRTSPSGAAVLATGHSSQLCRCLVARGLQAWCGCCRCGFAVTTTSTTSCAPVVTHARTPSHTMCFPHTTHPQV